jgi:hypothetical protein
LTGHPLLWVETLRDWSIIFMGITFAAFFVVLIVVMIIVGLGARSLLSKSAGLLDEGVKPMLESAKEATANARGTSQYLSDAAVGPVIRTYGVVAGVRRAAGLIVGLTQADSERDKNN